MSNDLKSFFETTFEEKLVKQLQEQPQQYLTPATKLLEKRREMAEVDTALHQQKEEFQVKMDGLQQRKEELERKEFQLAESLLKFDRFLKENDARRRRALKKAEEERDLTQVKSKEIRTLREEIDALKQRFQHQQDTIRKNVLFQKYLGQVIDKSPEFSEVNEILARYATLSSTNKDLVEHHQEVQGRIDALKSKVADFKEVNRVKVLDCTNHLAELQDALEKAQTDKLHWENQFTIAQSTATDRTLTLGRIKMATSNLYVLVQQRNPLAASHADTVSQLEKIQQFIIDLQDVTTEYEKGLEREKAERLASQIA